MKRMLFALGLVLCILISSCSNPGGGLPAVTEADRDQALMAIGAVNGDAFSQASTAAPSASSFTYTGPYFSLSASFSPDLDGFMNAGGSATLTETITGYPDPGSGYTISGTLTCVIDYGSATMTMNGNFTLSGGNVRTMTVNMGINFNTMAYSGSATVNGQTFAF